MGRKSKNNKNNQPYTQTSASMHQPNTKIQTTEPNKRKKLNQIVNQAPQNKMGYEDYFRYKKDKLDNKEQNKIKNYSLTEYVIFNMYLGILRGPVNKSLKNKFFTSYCSCLQRWCNFSERPKLENEEKNSVEVYFDILEQIENDFKKLHVWSSILTEKVRKFGWMDLDPTRDVNIKNAIIQFSNFASHPDNVISTIASNVRLMHLDDDDPLLSGIIDVDHFKSNHSTIYDKIEESDWESFSEVTIEDSIITIKHEKIMKWVDKARRKKISLTKSIKVLIGDFVYIWENNFYQNRSVLINESTFTHDVLAPIMNFIAPNFFKRWDQAQSLSSKDRGVIKFVDTIGNVTRNNDIFEIFFVEVSHGPFHPNPEKHIEDDNYKLTKLGKDGLDRNRGYRYNNVFLFHLHAEFLCTYVMDRKIFPITRKIPIDKIPIPFYRNDPPFKVLEFIKKLYKYRIILEKAYSDFDVNLNSISAESDFETFPTPKRKKIL